MADMDATPISGSVANSRQAYEATPRQRYAQHRRNAQARGIDFLLTFDEWLTWWLEDSRWERRGRHSGGLVMARYGDAGPYALGNIYPATPAENVREAVRRPGCGRAAMLRTWAAFKADGGVSHLTNRDKHPCNKAVATPDGEFLSAAQAARHYGITTNAATRRAAIGRFGWSYRQESMS